MAELVLITGGARSGKSRYAEVQARSLPGPWLYVATCAADPAFGGAPDPEMRERIARHRRRRGKEWRTVEEPRDLASVLAAASAPVVLIDCLALWVSNLLAVEDLDEDGVARRARDLLAVIRDRPGAVFAVTSEVGCGIVPANVLARRFRDCLGRCNQEFGAAANRVVMVVCGQAMQLKEGEDVST
ncbi:MAG TPA: bifunctional adenosylcobinamide kinase/adenosylcobinamide-phosphate guanylyltransferase [Desulfobacterales bacterium]|nr:bifunctional adenosylcobinamide kinase/adenosylcobinamide-phosphate guanylyltransferase [Desulfobacterales bacterium]